MGDAETPKFGVLEGTATAETYEAETAPETAYRPAHELRPLQARDLFAFATILKKIGVRQFQGVLNAEAVKEAIDAMGDDRSEEAVADVGASVFFEAAGILLENVDRAETDIYRLLASLSGMTAEEVQCLPLGEFADMLVDVFKSPGFGDFFKAASRLLR